MCGCNKKRNGAEIETSAQTAQTVTASAQDDVQTTDDGVAVVTQRRSDSTRR